MDYVVVIIHENAPKAQQCFEHKIGLLRHHFTDALQLAISMRCKKSPIWANDLSCVAMSKAQFQSSLCPENRTDRSLSGMPVANPVAYMDLDEFHGLAAPLLEACSAELECGDSYRFSYELANQIEPKLQLV